MIKRILFIIFAICSSIIVNAQVYIPDENFKNYLISNSEINTNGNDEISYAEVANVEVLRVDGLLIKSLQGIHAFYSLKELYCNDNELTSLNISNLVLLKKLICSENQLTSLDISNNTVLEYLWCENNQLDSLNVSENILLESFQCSENPLSSLDISKNTILKYLKCNYNNLSSLDVSNNGLLDQLRCSENQMDSLDISKNIYLLDLRCNNNDLTSLDISKNSFLQYLDCSNNPISCLDLSQNQNLTTIALINMPDLSQVCVWENNFPPDGVSVNLSGSDNISFSTKCFDIECISDTTVYSGADNCYTIVEGLAPIIGGCSNPDNYTIRYNLYDLYGAIIVDAGKDDASGEIFNVGETIVEYTITNSLGIPSWCSFTVTVIDSVKPKITCVSDVHEGVDPGIDSMLVSNISPISYSDNCDSSPQITYTLSGDTEGSGTNDASGQWFQIGETKVEYTIKDNSGNSSSCSFTVVIEVYEGPTLNCPADVEVNNISGNCFAVVKDLTPVIIGDLTGYSITYVLSDATEGIGNDDASGREFNVGETIVKYIITNSLGISSDCSFTVTVIDNENPSIICIDDIITCDPFVTYTEPEGIDNCSGVITIQSDNTGLSSGSIFPVGLTKIKYTARDDSGNESICSFNINVISIPEVTLDSFVTDSICIDSDPVSLPQGTPEGGLYTGQGIIDGNFDPSTAGVGTHTIIYTFSNQYSCGNSDSINITVKTCPDTITNGRLFIYPNPVRNELNVLNTGSGLIENIAIFTLWGQKIWEKTIVQNFFEIDVSNFIQGMYIIRVKLLNEIYENDSDRDRYIIKKFVKQ